MAHFAYLGSKTTKLLKVMQRSVTVHDIVKLHLSLSRLMSDTLARMLSSDGQHRRSVRCSNEDGDTPPVRSVSRNPRLVLSIGAITKFKGTLSPMNVRTEPPRYRRSLIAGRPSDMATVREVADAAA
jgi:hypothetical protein